MPEGTATVTTTDTGGANAPGGGNGNGNGDAGAGEPKTFTQAELDQKIGERLARERAKLGDVEDLKRKAEAFEKLEEEQKTALEKAVDKAKAEAEANAKTERDTFWKAKLLTAQVQAAAAGKLADPADAVTLLDLSGLELDDEGKLDEKKIAAAIDALLEKKPYLAAGNGTRTRTDFDAGARGRGSQSEALNGDPLLASLKSKLGIPD